jgi:predicted nicotinamide N-methyase
MSTPPWPPHLAWVVSPADGPRPALAGADEDVTCLYQWPAGAFLGSRLDELAPCAGRRVADLGCGRGALGLSACAAGAAWVLFADASPVAIDFLARTLAVNDLAGRAAAVRHAWGEPLPSGPFDVILGGDILYRPECFAALMATLAASLAPGGRAVLSDPRTRLEDALPALAAANGLRWATRRLAHTTIATLAWA